MEPTFPLETTSVDAVSSVDFVLRRMLDDLPDGVILFDENWRMTYANQAARRISRITPDHLNGKTLWELFPGLSDTSLGQAYMDVMERRTERVLNSYYYGPFDMWVEVHLAPGGAGVAVYYRDVTVSHRSELARIAAAEQLEQVLAAATDGIFCVDPDFRITYMNPRGLEIASPITDIVGSTLWEKFPGTVFPGSPFVEHFNRAMQDRVVSSFLAFHPDPLNLWLQVTARPFRDGIIIFFRDVTDEKTRSEDLRSSGERYRILTELNRQLLWTTDLESRVLYANQLFLDYIGRDALPDGGDEYLACFDEADRERIVDAWSQSMSSGREFAADARLIRFDGESRWWRLRAAPIRDEAGNIQQWLGSAVDIHEERIAAIRQREQYAELDRQRRELETIYRGSPVGMALYEPEELRLVRINDRQAEVFRMDPSEAIGKRYEDLTGGVSPAHALIRRAAAGELVLNQNIEGALDRLPDEYRYWNVNYSPIFNEDGTVRAIASATIETTQQKRAEAALIQSEKLAAVGRMASSIAHEINNPLEAVTNLIYIARQYAISPEVRQTLELADQELRRVSVIANQTLRFHRQSTFPREITCSDLFATVLSLHEGRFRNSSITVERRRRARSPISCFEGDIRQVLNNLVRNAIDAMPNGGKLYLRSRETTDWRSGRAGIVLTVADTGTGISPEALSHIFEAFFTTKGNSGTGLGLWIGTEIVHRHQGRLLIRSSQNPAHRGTIFSLFLPFQSESSVLTSRIQ